LGGFFHEYEEQSNKMSEHMWRWLEVGQILKKSTAKVTIFRAAIILGQPDCSLWTYCSCYGYSCAIHSKRSLIRFLRRSSS